MDFKPLGSVLCLIPEALEQAFGTQLVPVSRGIWEKYLVPRAFIAPYLLAVIVNRVASYAPEGGCRSCLNWAWED